MNTYLDFIRENLDTPFAAAIVIALLIAYVILSKRLRRLPSLPIGLLVLYLILREALAYLPGIVSDRFVHWAAVTAVIVLYCAAFRITFAVTVELWFEWKKKTRLPKITRDFVLLTIYAIVTFVVLSTKGGVNLAGLITTSAVLTAVIGLAAQNTLGNFFAGLSLQMERPYTIGDWIRYGDQAGRVVGIGWKSTRLITFENEMIYVPNMDIAKTMLVNYSKPTKRIWMVINLGVEYAAPPNKVRRVLERVLELEPTVLRDPKPTIRVTDYGDFAITYKIRFLYEDYGNMPTIRGAVMNNIWYALRREGIRIPFPIRDVQHRHVERRFEENQRVLQRQTATADLKTVPLFEPLSAEALALIASRLDILHYGEGEDIVRQGEAGDSMYLLRAGACDVFVKKGDGEALKVASLEPPAFFGEMCLLTGDPRTATVKACSDSTLFRIDKQLFGDILAKDASISERLAEALANRQVKNAEALGRVEKDRAAQVQSLTTRIRSFFGLS
jgi:small-conductance mechanosensitive channel